MLVRYRETGRLASLRGVIGRLIDGAVYLRGRVRDVRETELETPRYWVQTDTDWHGPFVSQDAAVRLLNSVLTVWGEPAVVVPSESLGWIGFAAGCRLRVVPGGERCPIDSHSDCR